MIHAVFCADIVERTAAIKIFRDMGLHVQWYGPDDVVRPERLAAGHVVACAECEKGPGAFLVVASPDGKGPFPPP